MRHWYPGAGDPFAWPLSRFFRLLNAIVRVERWKRGEESGAAAEFDRDIERWERGLD